MHRVELVDERARPVVEHVRDRHVVGDREGEIQVGVAVAAAEGERADGRSGNGALVALREPQHALAESIPLLNREHGVLPRRPRLRVVGSAHAGRGTGSSLTGVISATVTPVPGSRNCWRWTMSSVSTTR